MSTRAWRSDFTLHSSSRTLNVRNPHPFRTIQSIPSSQRGVEHPGVGKVRDAEPPSGPLQGENVIANQTLVGVPYQPGGGELLDATLLGGRHGFESLAGRQRLTRLHLDEHERGGATHDEIELAVARAHIARDDAIPAQAVEPRRPSFRAHAEMPGCHRPCTHATPRVPR